MDFDGATYDVESDGDRLSSQLQDVKLLMSDHEWRTLAEIAEELGYPDASVPALSARLRDLRKPKFGGFEVESRRKVNGGGLWEYRVLGVSTHATASKPSKPSAAVIRKALADLREMKKVAVRHGFRFQHVAESRSLALWLKEMSER